MQADDLVFSAGYPAFSSDELAVLRASSELLATLPAEDLICTEVMPAFSAEDLAAPFCAPLPADDLGELEDFLFDELDHAAKKSLSNEGVLSVLVEPAVAHDSPRKMRSDPRAGPSHSINAVEARTHQRKLEEFTAQRRKEVAELHRAQNRPRRQAIADLTGEQTVFFYRLESVQ